MESGLQAWTVIAAIAGVAAAAVAFINALLTALYVWTFRSLQTELNRFSRQAHQEAIIYQRITLQRDRLVSISNQWNSPEYATARVRADMYFEAHRPTDHIKYDLENIEVWSDISTIVHFFETLGILIQTAQIQKEFATPEFKEVALYWFARLRHIYNPANDEANTYKTFVSALHDMGCTDEDIQRADVLR